MTLSILAIVTGIIMDLIFADPRELPHPVVLMGKLIEFFEKVYRGIFPKNSRGEKIAGFFLWLSLVVISTLLPYIILRATYKLSIILGFAIESIMSWQILAAKSLYLESMAVYKALEKRDLEGARYAVSMIVGRDTESLNEEGICKATIETISENTADGVIAPLMFLVLGGPPLGFLYKAVNTMDSMLGYRDGPNKYLGYISAKMDDFFNYIPARLSALLMLGAGFLLRLDVKNGWKIFKRDRYRHASPNSAQTEAACAGLLEIQLAGDAWYHGTLYKKEFIGDPIRQVKIEDIPLTGRLMFVTSALGAATMIILKVSL